MTAEAFGSWHARYEDGHSVPGSSSRVVIQLRPAIGHLRARPSATVLLV